MGMCKDDQLFLAEIVLIVYVQITLAVLGLEEILSLLEWQEPSTKVGGYWPG